MKKYLSLIAFFLIALASASQLALEPLSKKETMLYHQVFKKAFFKVAHRRVDTISENPINSKVLKIFAKDNHPLGFIREVTTTTGCNSECLPLIFTLFYDLKGNLKKVLSRPGLTKIGHEEFSHDDYLRLELILFQNLTSFNKIKHPKEMTDAISGATKKKYQSIVVKGAAYSTLRIHLYNQDTKNFIQTLQNIK